MRLAGYIRESTDGQLDGFGLEDQERIERRCGSRSSGVVERAGSGCRAVP
ncbi:hypothetical protein [Streptomyces sp. NPDC003483]